MALHARDGWYFERDEHGCVAISKRSPVQAIVAPYGELASEQRVEVVDEAIVLTDFEWASIVAAVSAKGETSTGYAEALTFHRDP